MHPHFPHRASPTSMNFHPDDFGMARMHVCSLLTSLRTHSLEFSTPQLPVHQPQHPRSSKSPVTTRVPTTVPPITQAPSTQSPTQFGGPLSLALPQCARGVPLLPAAFCCADAAAAVGDAALHLQPAAFLLGRCARAALRAVLQRERGGCCPRAVQVSSYFDHGACGVTLGISLYPLLLVLHDCT